MKNRRVDVNILRAAMVLSSSGLQLALFILAGVYAGKWLDAHFHTGNAYMIVGLICGFALGLTGLSLIIWKFFIDE
jgi:hypothetical protein